jgi:hypothetical protein
MAGLRITGKQQMDRIINVIIYVLGVMQVMPIIKASSGYLKTSGR